MNTDKPSAAKPQPKRDGFRAVLLFVALLATSSRFGRGFAEYFGEQTERRWRDRTLV
jgi:hypothetical protein